MQAHRLLTPRSELGKIASRFGPLAQTRIGEAAPRRHRAIRSVAGAAHLENGIEDEKASAGEHGGQATVPVIEIAHGQRRLAARLRPRGKTATWTVPVGRRAAAPKPALRIVRLVASAAWAMHTLINVRPAPSRGHRPFSDFDGEFDPGSGRTLAACLIHASRTRSPSVATPWGYLVANG